MTRIQQSSPHGGDRHESAGMRLPFTAGRIPNICVIGAGAGGLRCADVLLRHGFKVTILEGRDRIGGRIHQAELLTRVVDLGPNWIHGTDHNPILELAKEINTTLHSWDEQQTVFNEKGQLVNHHTADQFTNTMWATITDAFAFSNEKSESIDVNESLLDFFDSRLKMHEDVPPASVQQLAHTDAGVSTDGASEDHTRSTLRGDLLNQVDLSTGNHTGSLRVAVDLTAQEKQQVLWMAEMWGAFVGDPIQKQSLKYFWLEECIDGENLFVASTYKGILERISDVALLQADLQLSKKVTAIETLSENDRCSAITVKTSEGETLRFDEVVATTPLGWLKRNQNAFHPALSPRLAEAIDSSSYGRLEKVYIAFPSAFWQKPSPSARGTNPDLSESSGAASDTKREFQDFAHWMHPTYAPETNPHAWNQEAVNLAALPAACAHPTLLFYIYGQCSTYITDRMASMPASQHEGFLASFFAPYYSRIPNYDAASPACKPSKLLATSWCTDEMAGHGSYCNFQVGLEHGAEHIEAMRQGLPERRLWLAGEHTAPFVAIGTVTGAYWSGEAVAKRIVDVYDGEKPTAVGDGAS